MSLFLEGIKYMVRASNTEIKARIASILHLECAPELHRLREFLAVSSNDSVETARKTLEAASEDIKAAAPKHDKHFIPTMPKAPAGMSDADRGRQDAIAAKALGFMEPRVTSSVGGAPLGRAHLAQ
jgi:hypothetical protein